MPEKPHGNGRYRDGCRCAECRAGHAAANRGRRGGTPKPESVPARVDAQPDLIGPIEIAVRSDLLALEADRPLSATLKALALDHARRLDRLEEMNRPDLASPLHQRLMDALHELAGPTEPEKHSSLDELIRSLTRPS